MQDTSDQAFEAARGRLRGIAYRMLGSVAEAEDVLQDAWLRWHGARDGEVDDTTAFLVKVVTNLCLDRLKSARARREHYVGEWLPEPLVDDDSAYQPGPEAACEFAHDLSFALLRTLEALSPLERAAFLLHDVFDIDFNAVAVALEREPAACRQLAARARQHVRDSRPRYVVAAQDGERLARAFVGAVMAGDLAGLTGLLAADVGFYSDGGGKVAAVPYPLHGADKVARALIGFTKSAALDAVRGRYARINGMPGLLLTTVEGAVVQTFAFAVDDAGRIAAIYIQRNPDKLRHVGV
ncbi:MAG: sigma-70 family RNA polymerase sigma factor [Gammaproteobacteria bacterium]|nr:sigma-70 family RNA polymerase sigma factor [Gammaproteobacteria bacterium]